MNPLFDERQLRGITSEIATQRERWLAFWLAKLLPPVCIRWVNEGRNLVAVSRYIEKKQIRLVRQIGSTTVKLMQGNNLISTFEVRTTRQ